MTPAELRGQIAVLKKSIHLMDFDDVHKLKRESQDWILKRACWERLCELDPWYRPGVAAVATLSKTMAGESYRPQRGRHLSLSEAGTTAGEQVHTAQTEVLREGPAIPWWQIEQAALSESQIGAALCEQMGDRSDD